MARKVLALVSNFGYWGVELSAPLAKLEAAGFDVVLATPTGRRPVALPPSYDPAFLDPPLGTHVTTEAHAREVKQLETSGRLDHPLAITDLMAERPYFCVPDFPSAWQQYQVGVSRARESLTSEYAAVMLVGGSGPIIDIVNNQRVHDIILGFYHRDQPVAAICYGVGALVMARDFSDRCSILRNKHVTGHCIEYDYHDGTGFVGTDLNMGPPPYTLEYLLRDAVAPHGVYHGNFGKPTSVIVDYPFITARSLQCSYEFGEQFVNVLVCGTRRYGW